MHHPPAAEAGQWQVLEAHRIEAGELACKPDSVPRRRGVSNGGKAATIHLDTPLPGASSGPPAGIGRATLERLRGRTFRCNLLDLASGGVCLAIPVTRNAGALLPHRFTLTTAWVAVSFLWHFPASHLGLPLAITLLCEVRTFLDPTPDLSNRCEPRPPSQLVRDEHGTRCGMLRPRALGKKRPPLPGSAIGFRNRAVPSGPVRRWHV